MYRQYAFSIMLKTLCFRNDKSSSPIDTGAVIDIIVSVYVQKRTTTEGLLIKNNTLFTLHDFNYILENIINVVNLQKGIYNKISVICIPECCGECCLGELMSGGSSLNDTDFSKETDFSEIINVNFVNQEIFLRFIFIVIMPQCIKTFCNKLLAHVCTLK